MNLLAIDSSSKTASVCVCTAACSMALRTSCRWRAAVASSRGAIGARAVTGMPRGAVSRPTRYEASLPLGLADLLDTGRKQYGVPFAPGDRVLFYTDGISEARDKQGAFYPLHLRGALLAGLDPVPALDWLYSDILSHVGHEFGDDCLALIVCRLVFPP